MPIDLNRKEKNFNPLSLFLLRGLRWLLGKVMLAHCEGAITIIEKLLRYCHCVPNIVVLHNQLKLLLFPYEPEWRKRAVEQAFAEEFGEWDSLDDF